MTPTCDDARQSAATSVAAVLSIRPFRRLCWISLACSSADWMALLGLTGLVGYVASSTPAENFALSGVVVTLLLPGLVFAPLGGLLADRYDRRTIMIVADLVRCGLLLSIGLAGVPWWIFVANVGIGFASTMWIPSKDAAVPNLLRRPGQMQTAGQIGLVVTYGASVAVAIGTYLLLEASPTLFGTPHHFFGGVNAALDVILLAAALYLVSAVMMIGVPELSLRRVPPGHRERTASRWRMLVDGARYVRTNRTIGGLLIGAAGSFVATGALIGAVHSFAASLFSGEQGFLLTVAALFAGLAAGVALTPRAAAWLPHDRLFGVAVIGGACVLALAALARVQAVALVAFMLVGAGAGIAYLTGVTIIGTRVDDEVRGRINGLYQSMTKIIIGGAVIVAPVAITAIGPAKQGAMDPSRPVLGVAAAAAAVAGVAALRIMAPRVPSEPDIRRTP